MEDKIWIELPKPLSTEHANRVCDKANVMMKKLGVRRTFLWMEDKKSYIIEDDCGFYYLHEHGSWFSLDYIARETA